MKRLLIINGLRNFLYVISADVTCRLHWYTWHHNYWIYAYCVSYKRPPLRVSKYGLHVVCKTTFGQFQRWSWFRNWLNIAQQDVLPIHSLPSSPSFTYYFPYFFSENCYYSCFLSWNLNWWFVSGKKLWLQEWTSFILELLGAYVASRYHTLVDIFLLILKFLMFEDIQNQGIDS